MKKYTSQATKWLMIVSLICGVVLLTGIILAFAGIGNIGVLIDLILMGGLLGIIFFSCFIAEKGRALIIDADQITFPRGAEINGKTVFQKTTIQSKQIRSVEIKFQPGDGVIAKDTNFYTLRLKDGTSVTVTLYSYGKEAEKEISKPSKAALHNLRTFLLFLPPFTHRYIALSHIKNLFCQINKRGFLQ